MDISFFIATEEKVPSERRFRNKARPDATEEKVPLERGQGQMDIFFFKTTEEKVPSERRQSFSLKPPKRRYLQNLRKKARPDGH